MATLNNNQVFTVIKSVLAQTVGGEITATNLQGIIDTGNDPSVIGSKEQFTQALVNTLAKNWYTDTAYRSQYYDPFYVDNEKFGAIVQTISVEVPEVRESQAWKTFENGVSQVGQYTVYLPVVHSKYYGKSVSWELPITITYEQWDTAFKSASELSQFVNYIMLMIDNALTLHLENMNALNRNNFMAEKIAYSKTPEAKGVHKINLVEVFAKLTGKNALTVKEYLADEKALRNGVATINQYVDYFDKMNTQFNTAGRQRFTPDDRKVLQVLSAFYTAIESVSLTTAFNEQYARLKKDFQKVPFWQSSNDFDFNTVSSINVVTSSDGTSVSQSGIVAFLCDKWSIMHTIKSHRVAVKDFNPEALTMYFYQYRDQYMNDLTMNAIVFTVEDYTAKA